MSVTMTVRTYAIHGATPEELERSMKRSALYKRTGFFGNTAWYVEWRYHRQASGDRCVVTTWTVTEKITVEMPRWSPASSAGTSLGTRWNRFSSALLLHERGHVQIELDGAGEIASYFRDQPSAATCAKLDRHLDAWGAAALSRIREADARYDAETRHGATQGAVWP